MIYVPRESWEADGYQVNGPDSVPSAWRYNTLHWPGSTIDVDDPASTLRGMQRSWVDSKGYSLGYNWAVFPDGGIWEIRSFDIRCAANGDQTVNTAGVAILLAVPDTGTDPTDAMAASVRMVVAETRSIVDQYMYINGHRDVRPEPTACPGDTIYHLIGVGWFEPAYTVPPPSIPGKDEDMAYGPYLIQDTNGTGVYATDRQFMTIRKLRDETALAGYRWQLRNAGAVSAYANELDDGGTIMAVSDLNAFGEVIS